MRHSSCPLPVHEYAASDNLAEQSGGGSASHSTIEPQVQSAAQGLYESRQQPELQKEILTVIAKHPVAGRRIVLNVAQDPQLIGKNAPAANPSELSQPRCQDLDGGALNTYRCFSSEEVARFILFRLAAR